MFLLSHVLNSEKNGFACKKNTFEGVMAVFSSILAANLFFLFFFMGFLRQARFAFIGNPFSYFFTAMLDFEFLGAKERLVFLPRTKSQSILPI